MRSFAPVLLVLLAACGGETDEPAVTVTDSAGVEIVTLPGADRPLEWSVEKTVEIHGVEGDDEPGFFDVADLTVLEDGRIAVLDRLGKQVVLFDQQGAFLTRYGREGAGPGEFQYPVRMAARPGGGVLVHDIMNRRMELFDSTLAHEGSEPVTGRIRSGDMAYVGGFLVASMSDPEVVDGSTDILGAIRPADTTEIVRYTRETSGPIQLESCGMGLSGISPLFGPSLRWGTGPDETVVVVGSHRYEVDVYQAPDFELERRIRRSVPVIEATAEMAEVQVGDGMRVMVPGGERVCEAAEVVEKRGFAPEVPPVTRVAVSPAGEIFVQRWAPPGEDRAIDVLAPDGTYRGTLEPGFPFPDGFLGPDRMVVKEEDELGLTSVVVYRIGR